MGPPRYTDATIVKTLEEKGIGRPSTYAPIISVLLDRYYVVRKARQLIPTILGKIINDMLSKSFPELLDPTSPRPWSCSWTRWRKASPTGRR